MNLICNSYANDSDNEPEPVADERLVSGTVAASSNPSKRPFPGLEERQYKPLHRPYSSYSDPQTTSSSVSMPSPVPVPGRYVSKRERLLQASNSTIPTQNQGSDLTQKLSSSSPTGNYESCLISSRLIRGLGFSVWC